MYFKFYYLQFVNNVKIKFYVSGEIKMHVAIAKSKLEKLPGHHANNYSFNRDVYPFNSRRNMRIIDVEENVCLH